MCLKIFTPHWDFLIVIHYRGYPAIDQPQHFGITQLHDITLLLSNTDEPTHKHPNPIHAECYIHMSSLKKLRLYKKKSRIQETLNLLAFADISTDIKRWKTVNMGWKRWKGFKRWKYCKKKKLFLKNVGKLWEKRRIFLWKIMTNAKKKTIKNSGKKPIKNGKKLWKLWNQWRTTICWHL